MQRAMLVLTGIAFILLGLTLPALAESDEPVPYFYASYGAGVGQPCGTCPASDRKLWPSLMVNNLSIGYVSPFWKTEYGSALWGLYGQGSLWGKIPRGEIGAHLGWKYGRWTLLTDLGIAMSAQRIEDVRVGNSLYHGQKHGTYAVGVLAERDITQNIAVGVQLKHYSSGDEMGINIWGKDGKNIGNDYVGAKFTYKMPW